MTGDTRGAPARGFASVVFDCDSTLVSIEGIDQLAGPSRRAEIAALTDAAMRGDFALEEVYGRRLDIIRPTRADVERLGREYVATLLPDARDTVAALLWLGKTVRILSGGLRPAVEAVARDLGLAADSVGAVGIHFGGGGEYAGFEGDSPLARSGGKEGIVRGWNLPRPALLVGDGVTDLEARPAVDCFAAYTAVVRRLPVVAGADVVLTDPSLSAVLTLAASPADRERLASSPYADLLRRGDEALGG